MRPTINCLQSPLEGQFKNYCKTKPFDKKDLFQVFLEASIERNLKLIVLQK